VCDMCRPLQTTAASFQAAAPPPSTLTLNDVDFFWTAAVCFIIYLVFIFVYFLVIPYVFTTCFVLSRM
jgi:hypothetical protein